MCNITFMQPSKFEDNLLKHTQVIAIFLRWCEKKKEYEETKVKFEGAYLSGGLADSA